MREGTQFFRCTVCAGVVSPWDINQGGCPRCTNKRLQYTNLTIWEMLCQIVKHPILLWEDHANF